MELNKLEEQIEKILFFIKEQLHKAKFSKLILGISGGIDSALVLSLCVQAIGKENVIGLMMPYKTSSEENLNDAIDLAKKFEINYYIENISKVIDAYKDFSVEDNKLRLGNFCARVRMCILYDYSAKYKAIVVGTGNKSEIMTGYYTIYGDSACGFKPIAHLYKTQVVEMSKILNIPQNIIDKKPSADLWEEQTDEKEFGFSYSELDNILFDMLENEIPLQKLREKYPNQILDKVIKMMDKSKFKREMPPTLK